MKKNCRFFLLLLLAGVAAGRAGAGELEAARLLRHTGVGNVYVETAAPVMTPALAESGEVRYELLDVDWQVLDDGVLNAGDAELRLAPLPVGYYWIRLHAQEHTIKGLASFCVVPDPATRQVNPGMFYAVDSAQSWLAAPDAENPHAPADGFQLTAELTRLAGIGCVRERLSWAGTEVTPGAYNFWHYQQSVDTLSRRGIQVLNMFHDSPAWSRERSPLLPDDLGALCRYSREAARTFGGQVQFWEFWNEQDLLNSVSESAWDYAAALKAAAYGFRAGNPAAKVLNGGYSLLPIIRFDRVVLENDALKYLDIFNFHTYKPLDQYPQLYRDIRQMLAEHGRADMPIWITESGTNVEGPGETESYLAGMRSHSIAQELLHAEFLLKSHIFLQAQGFDRNFTFVLPPYNERGGSKDWGILRRDFSVKPAYAVFSTLTSQLGNAVYCGRVPVADPRLLAFAFAQSDGTQSMVLWRKSEIDAEEFRSLADQSVEFTLADQPNLTALDMWGRPIRSAAGTVSIGRRPVYLHGLRELVIESAAEPPPVAAADASDWEPGIVFRLVTGEAFRLPKGRDHVLLEKDQGTVTLQIWNLTDTEKSGVVSLQAGSIAGMPESFTIPGGGVAAYTGVYTPSGVPGEDLNYAFTVSGEFGGKPVSDLVMPVRHVPGLKALVTASPVLGAEKPENWVNRASGELKITTKSDGAVAFDVRYPVGVDRWVYPELNEALVEGNRGALGLAFEIRATSENISVADVYVMISGGEGAQWIAFPAPERDWQECFVVFESPVDEQGQRIAVGMNPQSDLFGYELRNLRWLHGKK